MLDWLRRVLLKSERARAGRPAIFPVHEFRGQNARALATAKILVASSFDRGRWLWPIPSTSGARSSQYRSGPRSDFRSFWEYPSGFKQVTGLTIRFGNEAESADVLFAELATVTAHTTWSVSSPGTPLLAVGHLHRILINVVVRFAMKLAKRLLRRGSSRRHNRRNRGRTAHRLSRGYAESRSTTTCVSQSGGLVCVLAFFWAITTSGWLVIDETRSSRSALIAAARGARLR